MTRKRHTLPIALGYAGLLPQLAFVLAAWLGPDEWRWTALGLGWGYAALIFSFLGGAWWGLAAGAVARNRPPPGCVWIVAVFPSLLALATFYPWIVGAPWPMPSLIVLGTAIAGSFVVDIALARFTPPWWLGMRIPLSLGLGLATILLAVA